MGRCRMRRCRAASARPSVCGCAARDSSKLHRSRTIRVHLRYNFLLSPAARLFPPTGRRWGLDQWVSAWRKYRSIVPLESCYFRTVSQLMASERRGVGGAPRRLRIPEPVALRGPPFCSVLNHQQITRHLRSVTIPSRIIPDTPLAGPVTRCRRGGRPGLASCPQRWAALPSLRP